MPVNRPMLHARAGPSKYRFSRWSAIANVRPSDASVAMTSVAAQILMSVRKLENWWLWIAANVLSIGLYAAKALWITTGLYVFLLGLAIWGLARWQAARHEARP